MSKFIPYTPATNVSGMEAVAIKVRAFITSFVRWLTADMYASIPEPGRHPSFRNRPSRHSLAAGGSGTAPGNRQMTRAPQTRGHAFRARSVRAPPAFEAGSPRCPAGKCPVSTRPTDPMHRHDLPDRPLYPGRPPVSWMKVPTRVGIISTCNSGPRRGRRRNRSGWGPSGPTNAGLEHRSHRIGRPE